MGQELIYPQVIQHGTWKMAMNCPIEMSMGLLSHVCLPECAVSAVFAFKMWWYMSSALSWLTKVAILDKKHLHCVHSWKSLDFH